MVTGSPRYPPLSILICRIGLPLLNNFGETPDHRRRLIAEA
jgi:hypothetical protein